MIAQVKIKEAERLLASDPTTKPGNASRRAPTSPWDH